MEEHMLMIRQVEDTSGIVSILLLLAEPSSINGDHIRLINNKTKDPSALQITGSNHALRVANAS